MGTLRASILVALLAGGAVAAPCSVSAQSWLLDAYAGIGIPASGLSDFQKSGFSAGIGAGYQFNRIVGVRADLAGEWLKMKAPLVITDVAEEFDVRLYHYDASFVVNLFDNSVSDWILALDAGVGATTISFSGPSARDSQTRFTIPMGLSAGYMVGSNIGIFVRARSYLMFMNKEEFGRSRWATIPIWAGIGLRTR